MCRELSSRSGCLHVRVYLHLCYTLHVYINALCAVYCMCVIIAAGWRLFKVEELLRLRCFTIELEITFMHLFVFLLLLPLGCCVKKCMRYTFCFSTEYVLLCCIVTHAAGDSALQGTGREFLGSNLVWNGFERRIIVIMCKVCIMLIITLYFS